MYIYINIKYNQITNDQIIPSIYLYAIHKNKTNTTAIFFLSTNLIIASSENVLVSFRGQSHKTNIKIKVGKFNDVSAAVIFT